MVYYTYSPRQYVLARQPIDNKLFGVVAMRGLWQRVEADWHDGVWRVLHHGISVKGIPW